MKRWILIVQAESGECQFLVEAADRPKFEDLWDSDEYVSNHRWVELSRKREMPGFTYWLL